MKTEKMKSCPACGKTISAGATTCPGCGKTFTSAGRIGLLVLLALIICWMLGAFQFVPYLFR